MPNPIKYPGGWRVNFRHKGNRYRKQDFPNKKAAQDYIDSIISDDSLPGAGEKTLGAIISDYNKWSELVKQKAHSTMRNQRLNLSILCDWAGRDKAIQDLTVTDMRRFQTYYFENAPFHRSQHHLIKSDHKASWNACRNIIRTFFNWCLQYKYIDENPIKGRDFKAAVAESPMRILTTEEIKALLEYFDRKDEGRVPYRSVFFRTLFYTGLRRSELVNLKWDNVDLDKRTIYINNPIKQGKRRSIPVHHQLWQHLKRLPREHDLIFADDKGKQLYAPGHYWRLLQKASDELGIRHIRVHDLRHTFGAHLAMKNVPLGIIQRLLGHSNINQTMTYIDFYPERFQESVDLLDYE